jgi:hypothetical protein
MLTLYDPAIRLIVGVTNLPHMISFQEQPLVWKFKKFVFQWFHAFPKQPSSPEDAFLRGPFQSPQRSAAAVAEVFIASSPCYICWLCHHKTAASIPVQRCQNPRLIVGHAIIHMWPSSHFDDLDPNFCWWTMSCWSSPFMNPPPISWLQNNESLLLSEFLLLTQWVDKHARFYIYPPWPK